MDAETANALLAATQRTNTILATISDSLRGQEAHQYKIEQLLRDIRDSLDDGSTVRGGNGRTESMTPPPF